MLSGFYSNRRTVATPTTQMNNASNTVCQDESAGTETGCAAAKTT